MKVVKIGGVIAAIGKPISQNLVPRGHLEKVQGCNWARNQLRFLVQKHLLRQDVLLTGPPSPVKQEIVMAFCEMMNFELEIVSLNRDISESDLKQRRELDSNGNLRFVDMPPLSAAINGRVLFLDGIEKAERNVLPALNNLLENREMSLADGRKLVSPNVFLSGLVFKLFRYQRVFSNKRLIRQTRFLRDC